MSGLFVFLLTTLLSLLATAIATLVRVRRRFYGDFMSLRSKNESRVLRLKNEPHDIEIGLANILARRGLSQKDQIVLERALEQLKSNVHEKQG